tara:strand:- start:3982 stop:4626 length:645 start_codon:yes stop_codon:yes gene_type:complete
MSIQQAMAEVAKLNEGGVRVQGGKKYTMVSTRIEAFRKILGLDFGINSEILVNDDTRVVMKTTIWDKNGFQIGCGHAEEIRAHGRVNKVSAIENCETSSLGRALASIGLSGNEFASGDELIAAANKLSTLHENLEQKEKEFEVRQKENNAELKKIEIEIVEDEQIDSLTDLEFALSQKNSTQELMEVFKQRSDRDWSSEEIEIFTQRRKEIENE